MPLMSGGSREAMSGNIKELMRSGRKPKEAIAIALANQRKAKKMAMGGIVDDDDKGPEDYLRTMGEIMEGGNYHPQDISNPEEQMEDKMIAEALRKKTQDELGMDGMAHYAMGGLVEEDGALGTKPSEDMEDGTEEPMGDMPMKPAAIEHKVPMLTDAAMSAIEERRKKRKFMR